MEDFYPEQIVDELKKLAQTPDQITWLSNIDPEGFKDTTKALKDLKQMDLGEIQRLQNEINRLRKMYEMHFPEAHVKMVITEIVRAMGSGGYSHCRGCDC